MNAASNTDINFTTEENAGGSDIDTIPEESPEYYEPIIDDGDSSDQNSDNDHEPNFHRLSNGCLQNGLNSLDLSSDDDDDDDEEEEEEEEEEERMREHEMQRAFREDESRRRAPLTPENAVRVREAMRGISFGGLAPDWAGRVPEDRWIDQLISGVRRPPSSTTSSASS